MPNEFNASTAKPVDLIRPATPAPEAEGVTIANSYGNAEIRSKAERVMDRIIGTTDIELAQLRTENAGLKAQVEELRKKLDDEDRACLEILDRKEFVEEKLDLMTATILDEDIDWSCHETKWAEAQDEAGAIAPLQSGGRERRTPQSRADSGAIPMNPLTLTELARDRLKMPDGTESVVVWVRAETEHPNDREHDAWLRLQGLWVVSIHGLSEYRGPRDLRCRPGTSHFHVPESDLPRLYEIQKRVNEHA